MWKAMQKMFKYSSPSKNLLKLTKIDTEEFSLLNRMKEDSLDALSLVDSVTS